MVGNEAYDVFSTGQLLSIANAIAEKRESDLIEVLYLLMIDHAPEHIDNFREAIWNYLLKSTDEVEEIVNNILLDKEEAIQDLLESLEDEKKVKLAERESIKQATQRNLQTILLAERQDIG